MSRRPVLLLGFDSIHDVLRAEKLLVGAGIACDMVPTPRDLSSNCGMSIECEVTQRQAISTLTREVDLGVRIMLERCGEVGPDLPNFSHPV